MNNEIVIPVCELKAALPGLSKIVGRSRTLPVLQSVRVARDAEGKVSLMATDLDAFATYTVKEPQSGPAMEILMPLDQLTKTVKGMKAEGTITLIPDGKEKVKLWYIHRRQPGEAERQRIACQRVPAGAKDQSAQHAVGAWLWAGTAAGPRMLQ